MLHTFMLETDFSFHQSQEYERRYLDRSGFKSVNAKDGVQLTINRKVSGSENVKCHIFILSDAHDQFNIINRELESVTY